MPQSTNRQLVRDMNNTPVGQGTVYNAMLKISAATRDRAKKANEGEQLRLGKVTRVMERHRRVADNTQTRLLVRLQQQLKELQAFQVVLRDQFNVNNFRTLKTPPPRMSDRRRKLETMFYHSGFSQKSMQPEIRRQLKKTDPERIRKKVKHDLLETCKQEVVRLAVRNSQVSSSLLSPAVGGGGGGGGGGAVPSAQKEPEEKDADADGADLDPREAAVSFETVIALGFD
ncbi:uncharacterized protein LOC143279345 [Babylonia areolata]|uniref:uncharacterized protein LOC143279345 n=1 Tax=Babylonia areolata TaxID=304850 RepID=UPI003FD37B6F